MIDNKPDVIVIHIGRNVIFNYDNHEYIAYSIVNIGLNFKKHSVNDMLIYYIFVIKNHNLTPIVRQANEILGNLCEKNGYNVICNDVITTDYLWKDSAYLCSLGTYILGNFF